MTTEIQNQIKACNTLKDYLLVLQKNYDLKNCTPSHMIKKIILVQISKLVPNNYNPVTLEAIKLKLVNTNNLEEFVKIVSGEITMQSNLSEEGKSKLIPATKDICIVTGLKSKDPDSSGQKTGSPDGKKKSIRNLFNRDRKK